MLFIAMSSLRLMGGPTGPYAEWVKSERERQILCYHLYVEYKK